MNPADRGHMEAALSLAERAIGLASPNPPVGCLIARGEEVVGEGWHEYQRLDHAEVAALRRAGDKARGATAYVTLEPCPHQGRTPPCTKSLIAAGLKRVVIARIDPNPGVSGEGVRQLRAAGIEVEIEPEREEAARRAAAVIEPFACHVTTGLPLVVAKAGMSLDGRIAAAGGAGGRITSEEAQAFGQDLRLRLDAVLVGIGTVLADDPLLTYRGERPKGRPLQAVVLDSRLRTPPTSRLLAADRPGNVLIYCGKAAPAPQVRELESRGAEIVPVGDGPGGLSLEEVLQDLGRRKILGLLVEGGSRIHWSFVSARLADKLVFIVAPLILGGKDAVPSVGGDGYPSIAEAARLRIAGARFVGPDVVLEAYPAYSRSILLPYVHARPASGRATS